MSIQEFLSNVTIQPSLLGPPMQCSGNKRQCDAVMEPSGHSEGPPAIVRPKTQFLHGPTQASIERVWLQVHAFIPLILLHCDIMAMYN